MATTTNYSWSTPDNTAYVKDGASAIRTLGSSIDTTAGQTWKAWTAWTPTFTNLTVGNGTSSFYYMQIGKTIHVRGRFILGTTSSVGTSINISIPVALNANYGFLQQIGHATYLGATSNGGSLNMIDTNNLRLFVWGSASASINLVDSNSTSPFTWANTNQLMINATYEAA